LVDLVESFRPLGNHTIFLKSGLKNYSWSGCDGCLRIQIFGYPRFFSDTTNLNWELKDFVSTPGSVKGIIEDFGFEKPQNQKISPTLHFTAENHGCSIDLAVKFNPLQNYGTNQIGKDQYIAKKKPEASWIESNACEWRVTKSTGCTNYKLSLQSSIELNDRDAAYLRLELHDTGTHENCIGRRTVLSERELRHNNASCQCNANFEPRYTAHSEPASTTPRFQTQTRKYHQAQS